MSTSSGAGRQGARQEWAVRRYGEFFQFILAGTEYALGLRGPNNADSHVALYDACPTGHQLWSITDAPH
ncbi:hypothetical protein [Streptomyces sp. NPDC053560]|uniref:hypothetical protein n=1 Tax=Streptomyces sp. NPDC053560 TaxID=3365711 RepID=UPI0037D55553